VRFGLRVTHLNSHFSYLHPAHLKIAIHLGYAYVVCMLLLFCFVERELICNMQKVRQKVRHEIFVAKIKPSDSVGWKRRTVLYCDIITRTRHAYNL